MSEERTSQDRILDIIERVVSQLLPLGSLFLFTGIIMAATNGVSCSYDGQTRAAGCDNGVYYKVLPTAEFERQQKEKEEEARRAEAAKGGCQ